MDIMALGAMGELVGGVAVVVSLVYVGLQVRQNTSALRAGSAQAHADSINGANLLTASSLELSRVWRLSIEDPTGLTPDERTCADTIWLASFNSFDSALLQSELGSLDPQTRAMVRERIRALFEVDYARDWWARNRYPFTRGFIDFVERECLTG